MLVLFHAVRLAEESKKNWKNLLTVLANWLLLSKIQSQQRWGKKVLRVLKYFSGFETNQYHIYTRDRGYTPRSRCVQGVPSALHRHSGPALTALPAEQVKEGQLKAELCSYFITGTNKFRQLQSPFCKQ